MARPLRIAFVSAEVHPFSKTGGLADVSAALPRYLAKSGHDVRVFTPRYQRIDLPAQTPHPLGTVGNVGVRFDGTEIAFSALPVAAPGSSHPVYLIECPRLYDRPGIYTNAPDEHLRFAMLSRAAIETCQRLAWKPDIIHVHDWHAALVPIYLKTVYAWDALFQGTKTVLTIHNIGYQGGFPASVLGDLSLADSSNLVHQDDLRAGVFSFLKTGILYANLLTTVSETYAREIQTPEYGVGLHELLRARRNVLAGIVNGIDPEEWNPATDRLIPFRYDASSIETKAKNTAALLQTLGLPETPGGPVLGIVSRLATQKGFELLFDVLPPLLARRDLRLTILGTGEPRFETFFQGLQASFPRKVCFFKGFSNELAHLIEAGADMFLMPSRYEPCGLNQMYSMAYGTVPIVRRTGGLADTVSQFQASTGEGTGFVFEHFTADGLRWALGQALEAWGDRASWRRLMVNGMSRDYSWDVQGSKYVGLYSRLLG